MFLYSIFLNNPMFAFENQTSEYETGYILVRSRDAYFGEWKRSANGDIFLRTNTKGRLFVKETIDGVVSKEYFETIRNSSSNASLWESLLFLMHPVASNGIHKKKMPSLRICTLG
ncbi:hypothetical protein CH361_02295 [Leptospira brenneri]|nr:hypothetical protein CH361_02295 [Leptospira brenneri]